MWSTSALEGKTKVSVRNIYELFFQHHRFFPQSIAQKQDEALIVAMLFEIVKQQEMSAFATCCTFIYSETSLFHLFQASAAISFRLTLFSCGLSSFPFSGTCCRLGWFHRQMLHLGSAISTQNALVTSGTWVPAFHAKSWLAHGWAGDSVHAASWEQFKAFWIALWIKKLCEGQALCEGRELWLW